MNSSRAISLYVRPATMYSKDRPLPRSQRCRQAVGFRDRMRHLRQRYSRGHSQRPHSVQLREGPASCAARWIPLRSASAAAARSTRAVDQQRFCIPPVRVGLFPSELALLTRVDRSAPQFARVRSSFGARDLSGIPLGEGVDLTIPELGRRAEIPHDLGESPNKRIRGLDELAWIECPVPRRLGLVGQ